MEKTLIRREIEEVIHLVKSKQGDYYERMARLLADLLVKNWDKSTREAIKAAIRLIKNGSGKIKRAEIDAVLQQLARRLGINFAAKMDEKLFTFIIEVYSHAQKEVVGVQPSFSVVDNRAIQWLQENHVYWIGNYYDTQLVGRISRLAQQVLAKGMDRKLAGEFFKQEFGREFKRSQSYWEGLANHVITRAREFGHTEAYVKAGIQYLKVVAVLDRRTSKICRTMHGRIIPVKQAVALRDALIRAKNPESVKRIAPWVNAEQVKNVPSRKLPKGMALPPYHFNCRTRTVVAEPPVRVEQALAAGAESKVLYETLRQMIIDQEQPSRKEVIMLIDRAMKARWPEKKFYEPKTKKMMTSVWYHYEKHKGEKYTGWKKIRDMNQALSDLIRKGGREIYLQWRKNDVNIIFYDGRVIVVIDVVAGIIRTIRSAPGNRKLLEALNSQNARYLHLKRGRAIMKGRKPSKDEVLEFAVWTWLNQHKFLLEEGIYWLEKALIIKYRSLIEDNIEKLPKETRARIHAVDEWLLNHTTHPKIVDLLTDFTTEPSMTYWWEDIETLRKKRDEVFASR